MAARGKEAKEGIISRLLGKLGSIARRKKSHGKKKER